MTDPRQPLPENVRAAIGAGNLVEAIKLLREQTGLGLKEAKDLVDSEVRGSAPGRFDLGTSSLPSSVADALERGNRIEAIRLLREQTGLGLKEAKETIERFPMPGRARSDALSPGEVPRARTAGLWVVASAIVVGIVLYFVFRGFA